MRLLAAWLSVAAFACAGPSKSQAAAPPETADADAPPADADVRQLLELTNANAIGQQVIDQMLPSLRRLVPAAPEKFWAAMREKMRQKDIAAGIVPIYRRHLSARDVRELIAFYRSPAGRKFVSVQPAIVQESMEVGRAWGEEVAREVIAEARAHGYI